MRATIFVLFVTGMFASGCGYIRAGQWEDDSKNWTRAFNESRPADGIEVVHSWYRRTAHWTAEYAWFFELEISGGVRKELMKHPEMRVPGFSAADLDRHVYSPRPEWFLPKPLTEYDVFQMASSNDFLIFMERGSNRSFWTAQQL